MKTIFGKGPTVVTKKFRRRLTGDFGDVILTLVVLCSACWDGKSVVPKCAFVSLLPVRNIFALFVFLAMGAVSAHAQGNPPFYTDDAGTVAKKHWELDLGISTEHDRNGDRSWQAPSAGLGYGLTDNLELDYGVPLLIVRPAGESTKSGLGNSVAGVKWRFFEDNTAKLAVSVNPQVEFDNPTSSRRHGLVENNTEFLLPLQVQKSFGEIETAFNVGRTFHARESGDVDGWSAGVAAGRKVTERLYLGAEAYGEAARKFDHGLLLLNLGALYELNDQVSFSALLGRGVAGADRPDFVAFVGVQLMR